MEPTLREGTLILVNKMAFGIQVPFSQRYLVRWGSPSKNDIVVFTSPLDGLSTIKRCLAVAGDPLKVTAGRLVVGDTTLPLKFYQEEIVKPISRIPPESVFVAGDNADFSTDSRSFGPLSVDAIKGSIFLSLPKKEETHER